MRPFYEQKGEVYIIYGFHGFLALRILKYPDAFFRLWFLPVGGLAVGQLLTGLINGMTKGWAFGSLLVMFALVEVLLVISLVESYDVFLRFRQDKNVLILPKEKK
jgi:hypothetical protein